jgi:hypothetical protein
VFCEGKPVAFVPAICHGVSDDDALKGLERNLAVVKRQLNRECTFAESVCMDNRGQLPCLADWVDSVRGID